MALCSIEKDLQMPFEFVEYMGGYGRNLQLVAEVFPQAKLTLIDEDEAMIKAAKKNADVSALRMNVNKIKYLYWH